MKIEILAESVANARGVFSRGDIMSGPENDLQPLVASGAARWVEGPEGEEALQVDQTLWALNVPDAQALIAEQDDAATLRRWHTGEQRNPKYPPEGRSGVKDAIQERLGELDVDTKARLREIADQAEG